MVGSIATRSRSTNYGAWIRSGLAAPCRYPNLLGIYSRGSSQQSTSIVHIVCFSETVIIKINLNGRASARDPSKGSSRLHLPTFGRTCESTPHPLFELQPRNLGCPTVTAGTSVTIISPSTRTVTFYTTSKVSHRSTTSTEIANPKKNPSNRDRTSDLGILRVNHYSPTLFQLSYRRLK
ncbi:hypothetical protein C8Q80DRAFT_603290 [Daedaleopsis nitida]|nr:hypothetical protein C8Q80DRAFT_603290 [Daedaleopsis nitida]